MIPEGQRPTGCPKASALAAHVAGFRPLSAAEQAHVEAGCPRCERQLGILRRTQEALRIDQELARAAADRLARLRATSEGLAGRVAAFWRWDEPIVGVAEGRLQPAMAGAYGADVPIYAMSDDERVHAHLVEVAPDPEEVVVEVRLTVAPPEEGEPAYEAVVVHVEGERGGLACELSVTGTERLLRQVLCTRDAFVEQVGTAYRLAVFPLGVEDDEG